MQICDYSRQPIGTDMDKFLKVLKQNMQSYYEDIHCSKIDVENLIDFCLLPFEDDNNFNLRRVEKKELRKIITRGEHIKKELYKIDTSFIIQNLEDF